MIESHHSEDSQLIREQWLWQLYAEIQTTFCRHHKVSYCVPISSTFMPWQQLFIHHFEARWMPFGFPEPFVCCCFFFGFKVAFSMLSSQTKKNFIWDQFFRVLLLVCIRETLWATYLMCRESHPPIRNAYKFLMDNKPIRSQEMQYSRLQMKI